MKSANEQKTTSRFNKTEIVGGYDEADWVWSAVIQQETKEKS